ncbi:Putative aminodeoxychorismate lyase [Psilocybe cubensis]|nr:Putative aminodeoxychorismate lyase [Psilocybe cubensis]KAH9486257.1 Putative aminodeoxychorismate lyase [Psilocybe cubensis]
MEGAAGLTPYQLLTSTRYDPYLTSFGWNNDKDGPSPFFLLPLHLERLIEAADTHSWLYAKTLLRYEYLKASCLDAILEQRIRGHTSTAYKLRITVTKEGRIAATATPLAQNLTEDPTTVPEPSAIAIAASDNDEGLDAGPTGPPMKVYIDKEPTEPSIFTETKTTLRDVYERVKERNAGQCDGSGWDVLLYNGDGQVMETTIFNVSFYRGGQWVTPGAGTGCLAGVMRRWLLEHGRILEDTEGILTRDTISDGEWVLLCNGVQGCRLGKIYTESA